MTEDNQKASIWQRWRQREWWKRYLVYLGMLAIPAAATYLIFDQIARSQLRNFEVEIEASGRALNYRDFVKFPFKEGCFWDAEVVRPLTSRDETNLISSELSDLDSDADEVAYLTAAKGGWEASTSYSLKGCYDKLNLSELEAAERILKLFSEPALQKEMAALTIAVDLPRGALRDKPTGLDTKAFGNLFAPLKLLKIRALANIRLGHSMAALSDIEVILKLAIHQDAGAVLIDHLLASAAIQLSIQPIWEGLERDLWTIKELNQLFLALESTRDSLTPLEDVLHTELIWMRKAWGPSSGEGEHHENIFDYFPSTVFQLPSYLTDFDLGIDIQELVDGAVLAIIPRNVLRTNLIQQYRMNQTFLFDVSVPAYDRSANLANYIDELGKSFYRPPSKIFLDATPVRLFDRDLRTRATIDLCTLAIASEMFLLEHNRYPSTLSDLVPIFINRVPLDFWSHGEILYKIGHDGRPVIYSVGGNRMDDGGKPSRKPLKSGDLVWRYSLPLGMTYDDYRSP